MARTGSRTGLEAVWIWPGRSSVEGIKVKYVITGQGQIGELGEIRNGSLHMNIMAMQGGYTISALNGANDGQNQGLFQPASEQLVKFIAEATQRPPTAIPEDASNEPQEVARANERDEARPQLRSDDSFMNRPAAIGRTLPGASVSGRFISKGTNPAGPSSRLQNSTNQCPDKPNMAHRLWQQLNILRALKQRGRNRGRREDATNVEEHPMTRARRPFARTVSAAREKLVVYADWRREVSHAEVPTQKSSRNMTTTETHQQISAGLSLMPTQAATRACMDWFKPSVIACVFRVLKTHRGKVNPSSKVSARGGRRGSGGLLEWSCNRGGIMNLSPKAH
ncbi:hypothetical protein CONPUDRAFT_76447 [Coniophora puteana RWD-64-598 SS2]|uniref:Uncharacterized protein n=1 Tax=Coniophora puteana (strain RWD-64-598) TaxID=741705 RepID=A0A5M3ME51_CONPW|nr:uncharacterized protein CONPUDRAFT_76447 [Coniophora puteana RWD-64-598 SS2]EIW76895.1 hypothetical protein CONPUDRAFT_76447 [Coniophora puteana RWD-64-598 SS2]